VTLLVISGLFWLLLIWGMLGDDLSPGDALLGGLVISAIPIGIGVWLVRGKPSGEGAPHVQGPADLISKPPPAVEPSRVDAPPIATPAGKAREPWLGQQATPHPAGYDSMTRGIMGTLILGSLYATGYVLFNGLDRFYELFGLGFTLGGGEALAASLASAAGAFALLVGIGRVEEPADGGIVSEPRRVYLMPFVVAGVALLGVAGYLLFQGDSGTYLEGLSVGDCFQVPEEVDIVVVEVVPCDDPHDLEVFALRELPHSPDDPYPGILAVEESAFTTCFDDFQPYVGAQYETSALDIFWIVPSSGSWEEGDRAVVCSLIRLDLQRSVGSAQGLGQ
jgi:hypothetical protein